MLVVILKKLCVVPSAVPNREVWTPFPLTSPPLRPHSELVFFTWSRGPLLCSENTVFGVERRMAAEGPYQEELDKRNPYSLPTKHLHPVESKGGS